MWALAQAKAAISFCISKGTSLLVTFAVLFILRVFCYDGTCNVAEQLTGTRPILADILLLASHAILPGPAIPASTTISASLKRVQKHVSPVIGRQFSRGSNTWTRVVSRLGIPGPAGTTLMSSLYPPEVSGSLDRSSTVKVPSYFVLYMQSVHITLCFICKVSLLFSALYAKCPYYLVLYMQNVLII